VRLLRESSGDLSPMATEKQRTFHQINDQSGKRRGRVLKPRRDLRETTAPRLPDRHRRRP